MWLPLQGSFYLRAVSISILWLQVRKLQRTCLNVLKYEIKTTSSKYWIIFCDPQMCLVLILFWEIQYFFNIVRLVERSLWVNSCIFQIDKNLNVVGPVLLIYDILWIECRHKLKIIFEQFSTYCVKMYWSQLVSVF